jgi:hypothetical protein
MAKALYQFSPTTTLQVDSLQGVISGVQIKD